MGKWLKMPSSAGGLGSNAKVPGIQSSLENGMMGMTSTVMGQEVSNGIGLVDCSTVLSYEQMIIDDDIIGRALRIGREVPVNKETLHIDMIKDVGILGMGKKKGSFLGERATMMESREFFRSHIFTSEPYDQWAAKGKTEMEMAKEKADWVLKNHEPTMLDADISKKLGEILKEAAKTL
jgi:trimethylamine--corrinoid protein Co-methyltransferase